MSTSSRSSRHQKSSSLNRASIAAQKTEITIHVYDLLPPGRLSSVLWTFGGSLLHTGVVINGKEYAYGGHDRKGVSGVYYTKPGMLPPGGTFRCEMLHGITFHTEQELHDIINETSHKFQGTSYNLLSNNCNHFTSYLCEQLTGKPAPSWINRAASIGLALPCMVPKEWVSPPDHDTADGELVEDDEDDENVGMLASDQRRQRREATHSPAQVHHNRLTSRDELPPPRVVSVKDTSGRPVPPSERAPVPKH